MTQDRSMDDRLDAMLDRIMADYPEPPPPPVELMWDHIEAEHFAPPRLRIVPGFGRWRTMQQWGGPAAGLAAGLLLGVGLGFGVARSDRGDSNAAARTVAIAAGERALAADSAFHTVPAEYFDRTVALLAALPTRLDDAAADERLVSQASELLSTTRVLLDSPAGANPQLQSLLDDLELVLVQIVRFPSSRDSTEAELINEAVETRDMLPRLRSAAAQASPLHSSRGD